MTQSNHILIQFAHPVLDRSRVNKALIEKTHGKTHVVLNELYAEYPNLDIDVDREKTLLRNSDVLIFQFPLFWFSTPAILKEWQDLVLQHGWAYGDGDAMSGKILLPIITTGGSKEAYTHDGQNHLTIWDLLAPLRCMSATCKMVFSPPWVVHGTHLLTTAQINKKADEYEQLLDAIAGNQISFGSLSNETSLNNFLDRESSDGH